MPATALNHAAARVTSTTGPAAEHVLVLYGDFNCPWSYLASRRAARLAADGLPIDWRAVEHDAPRRRRTTELSPQVRLGRLLEEMRQVPAMLLPGEELPYALAGFVPYTGAATAGYAEAYLAGADATVRELLFEALWLHSFDLDDPCVVHTLVVDAVRCGAAVGAPLPAWEYGGRVAPQAASEAGLLIDEWAAQWGDRDNQTVPMLVVDGQQFRGVDAVMWLGSELLRRGLISGGWERPAETAM